MLFADYIFFVTKNVYEPAEDSLLFAENLKDRAANTVVDIGTGCGILGIVAAEKADKVLAIDVNPYAVRCARENAELNHVEHKMSVVQGDLFQPIGVAEKFDLILFNAPYLPSETFEEKSWLGRAWAGGVSGRNLIDRFISEAPDYLGSSGEILLMQSTLSDVEKTMRRFEDRGLTTDVIARENLPFFETIFLVKAELADKK